MPYSDPAKMAEYMRQYRAAKANRVNVNPSVNRKPPIEHANNNPKTSSILGSYEDGLWVGICPVCNVHNCMDPKRTFRPVNKCVHFRQLLTPGKASDFLFAKGRVNVNRKPINPTVNHVNPKSSVQNEKYLLSYSRNKYQFVLYSIDSSGKKALIRSCKKNDKLNLGPCEIELTWGPEEV